MKHQKIAVWKRCDRRETEVGDLDLFCQRKVGFDSASRIDAQIQSSSATVTDRLTPSNQPVTLMIDGDRRVFLPGFGKGSPTREDSVGSPKLICTTRPMVSNTSQGCAERSVAISFVLKGQ